VSGRVDAIPEPAVDAALDAAVRALLVAAFPATAEFRRGRTYRQRPRASDFLIVARDGERVVASVALYLATARASSGESFDLGCIGNVCSDPDPAIRGQGHAAACVQRALKVARAREAAAALLFCREGLVPYYQRFGFLPVANPIWLRASASGERFLRDHHDLRMVLPLRHPEWDPSLELELDLDDF
jgi:predicted N-acetyltransferase YhbS